MVILRSILSFRLHSVKLWLKFGLAALGMQSNNIYQAEVLSKAYKAASYTGRSLVFLG